MIRNGMQSDAVPSSSTFILRQNFDTLLRQVSKSPNLTGFSKYMRDGLSEITDLQSCENMEMYPYLKKLYGLQLIHPQNVDFILNFAEYKGDIDLVTHIVAYYGFVKGKEELLIPAKFKTSSDFFLARPNPITTSPPQINPQFPPANDKNPGSNISSYHQPTTIAPVSEPQPVTAQQSVMPNNIQYPFVYPITKGSIHGFCVIINNEKFYSTTGLALKERVGTKRDGEQLENTFSYLGYHTQTYNDLTTYQMRDILNNLSRVDHSQFDSFVCCLLSHGNAGVIYGSDSVEIGLREIYSLFDSKNSPTLCGKPKIFIVQACRGTEIDKGAKKLYEDFDTDEQMQFDVPPPPPFQNNEIPLFCDFLIAYGTVEGFVAWRHPEDGSWFIDILCNKLCELFNQFDIIQILTFVNHDISQKKTTEGSKQMAAPVNMLKGIFYFKPPSNIGIQVNYI